MKRARPPLLTLGLFLLLMVPVLSACGTTTGGSTSSNKPTIKVGLVTDTGGLNDKGFNHLAYVGLQTAMQNYSNVKGSVKQSTSQADYVPNLTSFASQGYNLVIGVGFLMANAVAVVAQQFPNVH